MCRVGGVTCFDVYFFFFFKQKTAYEMRISDWSSDMCSSDLQPVERGPHLRVGPEGFGQGLADLAPHPGAGLVGPAAGERTRPLRRGATGLDRLPQIGRASCRERVLSVRVDFGGRRIYKTKIRLHRHTLSAEYNITLKN